MSIDLTVPSSKIPLFLPDRESATPSPSALSSVLSASPSLSTSSSPSPTGWSFSPPPLIDRAVPKGKGRPRRNSGDAFDPKAIKVKALAARILYHGTTRERFAAAAKGMTFVAGSNGFFVTHSRKVAQEYALRLNPSIRRPEDIDQVPSNPILLVVTPGNSEAHLDETDIVGFEFFKSGSSVRIKEVIEL